MAPELLLALIQIILGLALSLVGGYLAKTRTAESATVRVVAFGKTLVLMGMAATLFGIVGVTGATNIIGKMTTAVTQSVIGLAAIAVGVRFCLKYGRTSTG